MHISWALVQDALQRRAIDGSDQDRRSSSYTSKQSLSLCLALHELATNAVKYGALSNAAGKVRIEWVAGRPDTEDAFVFRWIEEDGPEVQTPARQGFGSRIIQMVLPHDFGGEALLSHDPAGVRFELRTSMRQIGGSLTPAAEPPASTALHTRHVEGYLAYRARGAVF